jgi:MOSC domain-containing protein YiiM
MDSSENTDDRGAVIAVHLSRSHTFSKRPQLCIRLLEGLGVEGDAHCGPLVKHRFDARRDPTRPNLRQVHLLQSELLDEVRARGFEVAPGEMGENVSTAGIDLLGLPQGAWLHLGPEAVVEVTGLRTPCVHIERFREGLLAAVIERRPGGHLIRKAGVMAVVVRGGMVQPGDSIRVQVTEGLHRALGPV